MPSRVGRGRDCNLGREDDMRGHKTGLAALALTLCLAAVALVFAATPWAGSTGGRHATAQLKAAWIYVGPHNDGGWSQAHDKGRQYVQQHLGSKVKTTFKENVPEGPQATHPGVKVKLVWTNSWFAPDKERKAAENLRAAGADVLGQNVDSPATGQYAESKKIPWVGYDSNAKKFAPHSWLTAAVYNWGPYYLKRVKATM